jgi:hypothetical protein
MKKMVSICIVIPSMMMAALLAGCAKDRPARALEPSPYSSVTDTKVQRLLAADPLLKGHDIKVNTFKGEVKLDGVVETQAQREQAAKLAWAVAGVRGVENNLLVRPAKAR